ncbi:hypothetical protein [Salinimicrobium gaetbulicola]|uniref:Uncharacterized protein n=1 Tax=Salinimicrobium gaetbulicola TaxID=999702 RepID=A0ABW3IFS8_9FLAO
MFKSPTSKDLTNLVNTAGAKISEAGNKTVNSEKVKQTVSIVKSSSKEFSKKAIDAGKKTAESEKIKKATNFLGNSSKEVITECRKIASNVILNVSVVASLFFIFNTGFIIYGIYLVVVDFAWINLFLLFGLIVSGIAFSGLAAYRSYNYAQFKIGIGVYHLLESFFEILITTSIKEIENGGKERLKKAKVTGLLKKNGNDIIHSSVYKIPGIVRKPMFLFMEFVPFGDIVVEVMEESKRKATWKVEDQVMKKLDSHISALTPHKNYTRFVGFTLLGNILVMGCLSYWI